MSMDAMLSATVVGYALFLYLLYEKKTGSPQEIAQATFRHKRAARVGLITLVCALGLLFVTFFCFAPDFPNETPEHAEMRGYRFTTGAIRLSGFISLLAYGIARLILRRASPPPLQPPLSVALPPAPVPDFSSLSDGSQITTNLEHINENPEDAES